MKVVALPRAVTEERLIELLEELLADAKAGKIKSLAAVVFNEQTHYGERVIHNAMSMTGVGAAQLLVSYLIRQWEAAPSQDTDPA